MRAVRNDLRALHSVVSSLEEVGLDVVVFGGWAEELQGMEPARDHDDIDLLVLDDLDIDALARLAARACEVLPKRAGHKRGFKIDGVLVELFLAYRQGDAYVTCFWDRTWWTWPADFAGARNGLRVATRAVLESYRQNWAALHEPDRTRST